MPSLDACTRVAASHGLVIAALLTLACTGARAEPPVRSAQDAACRAEAKARVFRVPNPRGLEPEEIGRQIYFACMGRWEGRPSGRRHRRR